VYAADDLKPGDKVGRYALVRELGRGAMGAVYLAEDTLLKEQLCVKVLHPHLTRQPEAVARFHREIVLARRIAHKGVCRLFELHDEGGLRYITMEHVEGHSLRDFLTSDQPLLAVARVQRIIARVCEALQAAHDVGVIHRDLKPRNIMVRPGDEVSLLDFGIATAVDVGSTLTMPGVPIGTRHFIAPEVWAGRPATQRSDQFAVGVILFACLTGKMPFRARQDLFLLDEMRRAPPPPPSALRPELDRAVDGIALRALAFSPEDRFPDMRALAQALLSPTSAPVARVEVTRASAPTLANVPALTLPGPATLSSTSDPALRDAEPPSLDDVDPVQPTLSPVVSSDLTRVGNDFFDKTQAITRPLDALARGPADASGPLQMPATTAPAESGDGSLTVPGYGGPRRAIAALIAAALLALGAAVVVVAQRVEPVAVTQAPAPVAAPAPAPPAPAAPAPAAPPAPPAPAPPPPTPAPVVAAPIEPVRPVELEVEPAPAPRPARPERVERADAGERASWNAAKTALDRAVAERALVAGDDAELDRARARSAQLASQRRFVEAAQAAQDGAARAQAVVIDKAFVKKKLLRFNERFDDVKDPALRERLDATAQDVLAALASGAIPEANRKLNEGFALARAR
jgi:serine/threonine-protein kinase